MKISEYIAALEALKSTHGDLDAETWDWSGARDQAKPPVIAYRRILYGEEWHDKKVCRI